MQPITLKSAGSGLLLALFLLTGAASTGWSQSATRPERFQIKVGASYDRGDFGTSETTHVFYMPITFRYLGEKFDISVTPSIARVNTTGGIRLVDGVPTPTGEQPSSIRDTSSAAGDTLVRSRYYLVHTDTASIHPFVKLKIPTAPEDIGIGTGKADLGIGVEMDKQIEDYLVFGDFSYTWTGKPAALPFRNRAGVSFGVGKSLAPSVLVSGMVDWRQSIVIGNPNPTELVGVLTYRLNPNVTISPNIYAGLNDSSPDVGFGVELAFRFGN